jgi:hypothetical protein
MLSCRSCVSSAAVVLAVVRVPAVAVVPTLAGATAIAEIPSCHLCYSWCPAAATGVPVLKSAVAVAGDLAIYIFAVAS